MSSRDAERSDQIDSHAWYVGVTRYQWVVLVIASLGWVFDVFEGQIFVASMNEAMPSLLPPETLRGDAAFYNNVAFGAFLTGGALGGVLFGILSDRIGRVRTMNFTILLYSFFTCASALSHEWWHLAAFRFLVAMGVGGEWAVASALVAEVFPKRARAWSLGIFHASSVFGTFLAILAGLFIVANPSVVLRIPGLDTEFRGWRLGFLVGVVPALLVIWIRFSLREPECWRQSLDAASDDGRRCGSVAELFAPALVRNTLVGFLLAAVGMATFWGVHIYGKDLLRREASALVAAKTPRDATNHIDAEKLIKRWELLGMLLATAGGGLGLVAFGPICEKMGRRAAFLVFHIGGFLAGVWLFQVVAGIPALLVGLPIFGFLTLGMHAGYAIYFPELFPTRLRATGAGFCFNVGRVLAAPIVLVSGWLQRAPESGGRGYSLEQSVTWMCVLYLFGALVLIFAPETRHADLPQ